MSEENYALEFRNLQKSYGKNLVLQGVNLPVKKGSFLALLGVNGAGKTTLINCLSGMAFWDSGDIFVHGDSILDAKRESKTKKQLGIVEQEVAFDPFFTPLEILSLRRGLYGLPKNRDYLEYLLESVGLADKKNFHARHLSGGMKRRLMMAKAMAHEPNILVLDEPTAGVDIDLREQLYGFWKKLNQEGMTIILTTHYLEEAESLAEDLAILHQGKIITHGKTAEMLKDHERLLFLEYEDGEKITKNLPPKSSIKDFLDAYRPIQNIAIKEPGLEDVFRKIIHTPQHD